MSGPSTLRVALIYPELLGTYGDGGNAEIVAARARWRGQPAEVVSVQAGAAVPADCDIYLLGGGEDEPQALAAAGLRSGGTLAAAVRGGAVVLAVCAGLQVLGTRFPGTDGRLHDGADLVDLHTDPGAPRAVGDLVVAPRAVTGLSLLYGYENHGGRTSLGVGVEPLGGARRGLGNGAGQRDDAGLGFDGVWAALDAGLVIGTYLHGPVLAQNPELADLLVDRLRPDLPAAPVDDPRVVAADRAAAALRAARARQTSTR
jgi:CobQ-like glutamine amidotransferase family enzyme